LKNGYLPRQTPIFKPKLNEKISGSDSESINLTFLSNDKTISPSSGQVKFSSFFTSNRSPTFGTGQAAYQQLSRFEAKTEKNYTLSK
jgi:hypothetical protein